MAGRIIRVVPKTFVTFANIPGAPTNPTWFWLKRQIPCQDWREATLYVRLHPSTSITGTQNWGVPPSIQVYADGYTDEDPSVFATTAAAVTGFVTKVGSDTILNNTASTFSGPGMLVIPVGTNGVNFGGLLAIAIYAKQASQQAGDIYISIDMCGKE